MTTREEKSKIGKANKRKGAKAETESATFWSKKLDSKIVRTPRSGAFWDWPGDIFDLGNSILKGYIVERKFGNQVPKKVGQWMEKLEEESQGKSYFLEVSRSHGKHYVILTREHFAQLLVEIQGWRKENEL